MRFVNFFIVRNDDVRVNFSNINNYAENYRVPGKVEY